MNNTVEIRIVRSDLKEFKIDGSAWKIVSLEGFGSYENDITIIDNSTGDGGIYGSDHIASKDRTIVAKSRNPLLNEVLRKAALSFFNSKFLYKVYLTYMGKTLWCEGKIYKFNLPTGNIYQTMKMTVTFLFANPFLQSCDNFGKNIASITPMCAFPYLCSATDGTSKGVTDYSFSKWAADTASGTQYSAGATIVCTANTTMYAVWTRNAVTNKVLASGAKGTVAAGTTGTVYFDTTGFTTITVTLSVTSTYGYGWIANSKTDFSGAAYHISGSNTQTKTITLKANSGSQPISYKVSYDTGYGGNSSNTEWKVTVTAK